MGRTQLMPTCSLGGQLGPSPGVETQGTCRYSAPCLVLGGVLIPPLSAQVALTSSLHQPPDKGAEAGCLQDVTEADRDKQSLHSALTVPGSPQRAAGGYLTGKALSVRIHQLRCLQERQAGNMKE